MSRDPDRRLVVARSLPPALHGRAGLGDRDNQSGAKRRHAGGSYGCNTVYAATAMHRQTFTAAEAARALGISLDTLRRWDRAGKIRVRRDSANRRIVAASEIERIRGGAGSETLSARNRFRGVVRSVEIEGLLARIEIDVTEPARVVAIITRESAEELDLKPGASAAGVVKATSVMVER